MNAKQASVITLLRLDPRRDLYEGASISNPRTGSGFWSVTYTADVVYAPLTTKEVNELFYADQLDLKWPGCYRLSANGTTSIPLRKPINVAK